MSQSRWAILGAVAYSIAAERLAEGRRVTSISNHTLRKQHDTIWPVIIVGGGVSGLTTAAILASRGVESLILEGKEQVHGRTFTHFFPSTGSLPVARADLGANYLHGASAYQPVYQLALKLGVKAPVANGAFWEHTETSAWFDADEGTPIDIDEVAQVHLLYEQIERMLGAIPADLLQRFNLMEAYETAKSIALERDAWELTERQKGILESIRIKSRGYVAAYEDLGAVNSIARSAQNLHPVDSKTELREAMRIVTASLHKPSPADVSSWKANRNEMLEMARRSEPPSEMEDVGLESADRLVVNGYVWLVEHMREKLAPEAIQTSASVDHVEIMFDGLVEVSVRETGGIPSRKYLGRHVVITAPLGVLKNSHDESRIDFVPPLRQEISEAIRGVGMGVHNKVILRFDPKHKFWPNVGNFASSDPRFRWLNLDYYGQIGTLCTHIFPPYAHQMLNFSEDAIIGDVLATLRGMFGSVPHPQQFFIQRWNAEPFSLGSYSFTEKGTTHKLRNFFALPHPSHENPRVLFAGEHTVLDNQCVVSAYNSALRTANCLLTELFEKKAASDNEFPNSMLHARCPWVTRALSSSPEQALKQARFDGSMEVELLS